MRTFVLVATCFLSAFLLAGSARAAEEPADSYRSANLLQYPMRLLWGDTHLHTSYSMDANNLGNSRLGPEAAYRFALGEEVTASNGMRARLKRPLDFLVIADHAEYLGIMPLLDSANSQLLATETGRRWHQLRREGKHAEVFFEAIGALSRRQDLIGDAALSRSIWMELTALADRYNYPGRFSALIGYEWTTTVDGNNLHRNVIFRDGADKAARIEPFSALDSNKPEDLWAFLAEYEREVGGQALAIPHNPNISGGLMFRPTDSDGNAITRDYALRRARWEPLLEATQAKGDSESHPFLSPDDGFASYERWDKQNFYGVPHENAMFAAEYARSALKLGLEQEARLGVNPFRFGMIGSTDSHTGMSTADEDYFWGSTSRQEPAADRFTKSSMPKSEGGDDKAKVLQPATDFAASGLAAVWAHENTREAVFDALKRREVYATTGSRILLRFFGGWEFDALDHTRPDFADIGYRSGVPMGGQLTRAPAGRSPRFVILASRDASGANLERIQVIKGWLDATGESHEKVWDVALSDGRTPAPDGKMLPPVASTVDMKTATYTNTVGGAQLSAVWEDTSFDAKQPAFYYVRVLEIPTPRWTTYDSVEFGVGIPRGVPLAQQERAYSSPIWYTP